MDDSIPPMPPQEVKDDACNANPARESDDNPEANGHGNNIPPIKFAISILWAAIEAGAAWFCWYFSDFLDKHGYPNWADFFLFLTGTFILVVIAHGIYKWWCHAKPDSANVVWYGAAIIWCMLGAVFLLVCSNKRIEEKSVNDLGRPLVPANGPIPAMLTTNRFASNVVLFFLGNNLLVNPVYEAQPRTVVFGRENNAGKFELKPMIGVSVGTNGAEIFGKFFDRNGKIVAVIRDNKPVINVNNAFDVQRPDASTLIVHDQYDNVVLKLRYIRPRMFSLTGLFFSPDGGWANVTRRNVTVTEKFGLNRISGNISMDCALLISKEKSGFVISAPYFSN